MLLFIVFVHCMTAFSTNLMNDIDDASFNL